MIATMPAEDLSKMSRQLYSAKTPQLHMASTERKGPSGESKSPLSLYKKMNSSVKVKGKKSHGSTDHFLSMNKDSRESLQLGPQHDSYTFQSGSSGMK